MNTNCGGHALGKVFGITMLSILLLAGVANAITETQLTTDLSNDNQAVLSPDGKKMAFVSDRSGSSEIWVMNADGSGQTKLTSLGLVDHPVWSPDGTEIAFHTRMSGNFDIWKVSSDGSIATQLTNTAYPDEVRPEYSPDGSKIIYDRGEGGWFHLWIMNSDGTSQTPVATEHGMDFWGSWSPDGSKIAYFYGSDYDAPLSLALMNPDGTGKQTLTSTSMTYGNTPAWSPDALKVAFSLSTYPPQLFKNRGIYSINIDGTGLMKLADGDFEDEYSTHTEAWSLDGSKIIYYSNDSGNLDIWMMNPDGSSKEQLTTSSGEDKVPSFSPDGKRIIFKSNRNGNWDIYVIELSPIDSVGYSATIASGQNTFIQSSNGAFGTILTGTSKVINSSVILNNTGDLSASVDARLTDNIGGIFGLLSGANVLAASNFELRKDTTSTWKALNNSGANVYITSAPPFGALTVLDARLTVPQGLLGGAYSGTVVLTFGNEVP